MAGLVPAGMTSLRERIRAGEELLGTFLDLGSPLAAEIAAGAGFDWLVIDLEHGAGDRDATLAQLQAARAPALVRVPRPDSELIGWALDCGAAGVVVPRVGSAEEATRAARHTLHAEGRGVHLGTRAAGFGRDAGFLGGADAERVLMVQIETRGALADVDRIAALDAVDVLFLGPYDLGHALGVAPGPETPEVLDAAERVAGAARAAGKAAAVYLGAAGLAPRFRELGFTLLASGSTAGLLAQGYDARIAGLRR